MSGQFHTAYLTASLLDDLMISLAVGTPTRLKVMPWNNIKQEAFSTNLIIKKQIRQLKSLQVSDTYCFVLYIAQLVLFLPLVEADADSSPACSSRSP